METLFILLCSVLLLLMSSRTAAKISPIINGNNGLALHGCRSCKSNSAEPKICSTPECKDTASAVLKKMNTKIDPCDDFYKFACGKFKEREIPKDKAYVNEFSDISDKVQEQLKKIISDSGPLNHLKHLRLPNQLYKACINTGLMDSRGIKPIKDILDSLGGWPVLVGEAWNKNNSWTWQETVKNFRRFGFDINYIMNFYVTVDLKNSTKNIIGLDQPSIGLDREYLMKGFNDSSVSRFYNYMVDIAVLSGADRKKAETELRQVLQFQMDLAKISLPRESRRNSSKLYNLRSVKQLQELYPYVQWKDYINALMPEDVKVKETEVVILAVPSFFDELGKLLNRTSPRVIANYMMGRIHIFSMQFLSKEYRERRFQYVKDVTGISEEPPRWKTCIDVVSGSLTLLVGSLYVRKHFVEDSKAIALEMVEDIRGAFNKLLDKNQWMDDVTKQTAKSKLHAMVTYIGYPDEMVDDKKLEELYRNLEIDPDKYFEAQLNMNKYGTDFVFSQLRLPVNNTSWLLHIDSAAVNAFYSTIQNSIEFPAGILQGHFFNAKRPKYMNYGAIGSVIGHEITHGFDDEGRQFDADGNLIDWWQKDAQRAYLEKAKCIIEQYGNYTDQQTGMNLNGINTQGENIADNGGIKEAYLAYNEWASKNGEEQSLPGLNYTAKQMFWISAAQNWCVKYRTETLKIRITTGDHPPGEFRVLGPLRNTRDFSNDFQCAEGTRMNPVRKCEVW